MKSFKYFIAALLFLACSNTQNNDMLISIFVDRTDPFSFQTNDIDIVGLSDLDKNLWQSVSVEFSTISNIDINTIQSVSIPSENSWIGNKQMRNHKLEKFKREVQNTLQRTTSDTSLDHSIIYRIIATKLNELAKNKTGNKHLIILSDLMENSQISFYDKTTFALLTSNPKELETMLQKECKLEGLSDLQVWFLFKPNGYEQNNRYMIVANFYKHLFESKGAVVHVGNSIQ